MKRLKIVLVLAAVGALALAVIGWLEKTQKVVVLDPVRTVANQASAASDLSSTTVTLGVSSENVEILSPGDIDWREGVSGMEISTGTRVRTDGSGRAEIIYPGGTVTRLDHESEVEVATVDLENSSIVVKVLGGRIWSRVSRILGKVSYETRSTNVVASVRGTEYEHDVTSGVDKLMVAESSVDVSCVNGAKQTVLSLAQKATMDCGEGEPEIRETVTSVVVESDNDDSQSVKIEEVEESELENDWRKFNGAKEVVRRARQKKREKLDEASVSAKFVSEKVGDGVDENKSESSKSDNDYVNLINQSEKRAASWWSKISDWKKKSVENDKQEDKVGELRLKCSDNCKKLVMYSEKRIETGDGVKIEITTNDGKKIEMGEVKQMGRSIEVSVDRDDICSGGEFSLTAVYETNLRVEYGKFESKDLDCK